MTSQEENPDGKIVSAELMDAITGKGEMSEEDQKPLEVIIRFKSEDAVDGVWEKLVGSSAQSEEADAQTNVLTDLKLGDIHEAIFGAPEFKEAFDEALGASTTEQQDVPVIARAAIHKQEVKDIEVPEVHKVSFGDMSFMSIVLTPADIRATEKMVADDPTLANKLPFSRIEPVVNYEEFNDMSAVQIGVNPNLWTLGLDGSGVKVAVIDSGTDRTHPDLKDKVDDFKDFTSGREGFDGSGHGTHVAGTILGTGAASGGRFRGMAPGARLYVVKVLEGGSGKTQIIAKGVVYAASKGVDIINMSLGSMRPNTGRDVLSQIVNKVVNDFGVLVCVAAGNSGRNPLAPGTRRPESIGSPGAAEQALTVGAVNYQDRVADFSSIGPVKVNPANPNDPRNNKPDVCAPGVDIASTRAASTAGAPKARYGGKPDLPPNLQSSYTYKSGTSMATPVTVGASALLLQAYRKANRIYDDNQWQLTKKRKDQQGRNLAQRLKKMLMDTALKLPNETIYVQGQGRIQPVAAYGVISGRAAPGVTPQIPSIMAQTAVDISAVIARLRQDDLSGLPFSKRRMLERLRRRILQILTYLQSLRGREPAVRADLASSVENGFARLVGRLLSEYDDVRGAPAQSLGAAEGSVGGSGEVPPGTVETPVGQESPSTS